MSSRELKPYGRSDVRTGPLWETARSVAVLTAVAMAVTTLIAPSGAAKNRVPPKGDNKSNECYRPYEIKAMVIQLGHKAVVDARITPADLCSGVDPETIDPEYLDPIVSTGRAPELAGALGIR